MSATFTYRRLSIPYTDAGSGKTVILLTGFGETPEVWEAQVSFLQNHYRVIVPALPTPGWKKEAITKEGGKLAPLNPVPDEIHETAEDDYSTALSIAASIDEMAGVVAALIQQVTLEPVVVLGHSMGGYITLALAEKFPHLLRAFGLIHSTAFADTEEKKETRRKAIGFIRNAGLEAFFKTSAPGLFSEASKQQNPPWVQQNIAMAVQFDPGILIANYEAMIARPDRTAVLWGSKLPVLFIIGKEDKAAPAADVLKQVHLPQVSYFHILDNVAHMGMWEAAEKVNKLILKFLQDCE